MLRIHGVNTVGNPGLKMVGFKRGGGLCPIESYDFSVYRPTSMKIGATDFLSADATGNGLYLSYIYKSRLLTSEIEGSTVCPYFRLELDNARLIRLEYDLEGENLTEKLSLSFARMRMQVYNLDGMYGDLPKKRGDIWDYNLATGVAMTSSKGNK